MKRMYSYINLYNWILEKKINLKGFWRVISSSFQWRTIPGRTQSWGLSAVLTEAAARPLGPVQGLWMAEHSIHYSSFTSSCKFSEQLLQDSFGPLSWGKCLRGRLVLPSVIPTTEAHLRLATEETCHLSLHPF